MDDDVRELERVVESGQGTPLEIKRYIAHKLRGGCEAGAHDVLVGDREGQLRCQACGSAVGITDPGLVVPDGPVHDPCGQDASIPFEYSTIGQRCNKIKGHEGPCWQ